MSRGGLLWDLPTRLFHWALVVLIASQYASGEFGWLPMRWHYLLGYATLTLILFRVLWGVAGSATSRFAGFVRGPRAVLAYLRRGDGGERPGHNPLGGWSVLLMLAAVALQAVSGLFADDAISESGPFAAAVADRVVVAMTRIHHWTRWLLLALIALHLVAILLHALVGRRNLVAAMLHGRDPRLDEGALRPVPMGRALVLLALSAAAVWALIAWGGAA